MAPSCVNAEQKEEEEEEEEREEEEEEEEGGTLPLILSQRMVKSMTPITCGADLRHWPKIRKRGEGGTIMRLPVMLRTSSTL